MHDLLAFHSALSPPPSSLFLFFPLGMKGEGEGGGVLTYVRVPFFCFRVAAPCPYTVSRRLEQRRTALRTVPSHTRTRREGREGREGKPSTQIKKGKGKAPEKNKQRKAHQKEIDKEKQRKHKQKSPENG